MATAKIVELDETNTCKICNNALAIYSCPQCNIMYCSLECYRSNSHIECSEHFYKQNVLQELNLEEENKIAEAKMLEILQRTHENNRILPHNDEKFDIHPNPDTESSDLDSDDDPNYLDIAERLEGIDLDDTDQVWQRLTEDEKQDFVAFLKSEDVGKLIPSWEPWWMYYNDGKIEDLSEKDKFKNRCPFIIEIKNFTELTKQTPADCVKYNLINVLSAYAFTARYFNGEYFHFIQEAVTCIISLSQTLKLAQNFEDFETSIKSVEQECINSDWIVMDTENIQILQDDIKRILKGPNTSEPNYYILCALSDLHTLFEKASVPVTGEANGNITKTYPIDHFPSVLPKSPSEIKNHLRKIVYFLSYGKHHYQNI